MARPHIPGGCVKPVSQDAWARRFSGSSWPGTIFLAVGHSGCCGLGCRVKAKASGSHPAPLCFHTFATLLLLSYLQTMQALEATNMPRPLERKKPQMTDKIAALRMLEPGITNAEIAERLDTSVFAINQHAQFLSRTDGDPEKAVALRNDEARVYHQQLRKDARNWRDKTAREWHASGIPDKDDQSLGAEKQKVGVQIAELDRNEPGLLAPEVARRVGSTPASVRAFRYNQRKKAREEAEWQASGIDG